jgi:nucleolar protein 56
VRAASDLDRVRNLVGERLGSWVSRDSPEIDPGDHAAAARKALADDAPSPFGPGEGAVRDARRRLAELYRSVDAAQTELSNAVKAAVPGKTPNLSALLGPDLAARMLAQARGLDRLARLPSSTIQVLGAERAFFEHLRGNAPPPRHGLLFLHPAIQSASRYERGKLARTLAGKVAIAARLDRGGAPVDPALVRAFELRRSKLKEARATGRARVRPARSGKPLHAAAGDR